LSIQATQIASSNHTEHLMEHAIARTLSPGQYADHTGEGLVLDIVGPQDARPIIEELPLAGAALAVTRRRTGSKC
jgi:hypothetical protein